MLGEVLGIERGVASVADALGPAAAPDGATAALTGEVRVTAGRHAEAVGRRLVELGAETPDQDATARLGPVERPVQALQRAFALIGEAAMAYAALMPAASRFRDSAITAPEGMTGHLARDHMQDYVKLMGRIAGMVQDLTLRELVASGHECQCTCPACGIGACVCGVGARAALNEVWLASSPMPEPEVRLPRPRSTSVAAAAGLREGDLIVEADGVALASYPQLQTTIKAREMGGIVRLGVRRGDRLLHLDVRRTADLSDDGSLPLDCEAPSGRVFYMDRARDLQARLRKRANGDRSAADSLASLSVRETQVLRLLADGATNPMIAQKLGIARPTVARHVANILVKLDVTNRSEAAGVAGAAGLNADG